MIRSFSCKNFYSFADESSVSFVVNEKTPRKDGYFESSNGDRISNALVVVGPNASGKTNLLKVLPFLKWMIVDAYAMKPEKEIPVKPFLFHDFKEKPIELAVEFEIDKNTYIYSFAMNVSRILSEELKVRNKTKQKITTKTLFVRNWNKEKKQYDFDDKNFNLPKGFENENYLRSNASIISAAIRASHEESVKIGKFWQKIEFNVHEGGLYEERHEAFNEALNFFYTHKDLKKQAEKLLSHFDIGLEAFEIEKIEVKKETFMIVRGIHKFSEHKFELPIEYESSGTRQLFMLLRSILEVLSDGGVAVLDEFDINLHPEMVSALFELFISPETNPKKAQIIFITHSHRILSDLDKYQIILVEKNERGSSEVWRLDEMKGVRADDNYYSKYIAGAYGAVPRID